MNVASSPTGMVTDGGSMVAEARLIQFRFAVKCPSAYLWADGDKQLATSSLNHFLLNRVPHT